MRNFSQIVALAAKNKGGPEVLEALLAETPAATPDAIAAIPDDRILSAMARRVFSAGFSWKVIDAKWDAFEQAFQHFDLNHCAFMTEERFDALLANKDIVRNAAKIQSVRANAEFLLDLGAEHGTAARFFSAWPDTDYAGLLEVLKQRASRLGGETGMRFLRDIGKPAFIPTQDVTAALIREGVIDRPPASKRDLAIVQAACNTWSAQSGRNLTEISRILAMSVVSEGPARPRR